MTSQRLITDFARWLWIWDVRWEPGATPAETERVPDSYMNHAAVFLAGELGQRLQYGGHPPYTGTPRSRDLVRQVDRLRDEITDRANVEADLRAQLAETWTDAALADQSEQPTDRPRKDIRELIERGSLGSPGAKAARATVSDEQVARVLALAQRLRAERDERDEADRMSIIRTPGPHPHRQEGPPIEASPAEWVSFPLITLTEDALDALPDGSKILYVEDGTVLRKEHGLVWGTEGGYLSVGEFIDWPGPFALIP